MTYWHNSNIFYPICLNVTVIDRLIGELIIQLVNQTQQMREYTQIHHHLVRSSCGMMSSYFKPWPTRSKGLFSCSCCLSRLDKGYNVLCVLFPCERIIFREKKLELNLLLSPFFEKVARFVFINEGNGGAAKTFLVCLSMIWRPSSDFLFKLHFKSVSEKLHYLLVSCKI